MKRLFLISALSVIAVAGANAGPIAINLATAGNAGASVLNKNLAGNGYIPCTVSPCTTSNTTLAAPPSGLPTSFSSVLFNSVQVPFDIASGGANSGTGVGDTKNIWAPGNAAGDQSKTIDLGTYTTDVSGHSTSGNASGLFGVDQIWTMLNDIYATVGYQGITLTLSGYDAGGINPITENIYLTNGVDYRSIGSTSVAQDHTACDVANQGVVGTLGVNCNGHTSSTAQTVGIDSGYNAANVTAGVNITVYNSVFTTVDTITPTANKYWLDVQNINLGSAFLNGWLNTVTITSKDGVTGTSDKAIFSALTVDTITTPEPGTVILLLTGLAGCFLFQMRRANRA